MQKSALSGRFLCPKRNSLRVVIPNAISLKNKIKQTNLAVSSIYHFSNENKTLLREITAKVPTDEKRKQAVVRCHTNLPLVMVRRFAVLSVRLFGRLFSRNSLNYWTQARAKEYGLERTKGTLYTLYTLCTDYTLCTEVTFFDSEIRAAYNGGGETKGGRRSEREQEHRNSVQARRRPGYKWGLSRFRSLLCQGIWSAWMERIPKWSAGGLMSTISGPCSS